MRVGIFEPDTPEWNANRILRHYFGDRATKPTDDGVILHRDDAVFGLLQCLNYCWVGKGFQSGDVQVRDGHPLLLKECGGS